MRRRQWIQVTAVLALAFALTMLYAYGALAGW